MMRSTILLAAAAPFALAGSAFAQAPAAPVVHPEIWPKLTYPVKRDPAAEQRIAALIAKMSVEQKVGQIVQADLDSVTPADVKTYHLGSVLNGGNSGPYHNDLAPASDWLKLADEFWAASTDTSGGDLGIPVIWGTDAVHGHSNIIGATLFPHNIGLGAMRDPDLIQKIGAATAAEIRVTGQEWTFAPTVTVPQDYRWGRAYEGYSSNPDLVASYVGRMVLGLQGPVNGGAMLKGPYVLASTKHYLADGGTFEGRDQGDAKISEETLRDIHGRPYTEAIAAGVATVMTSFSSWNGQKLAGSKGLVTDVLKGRFDFGGFVVTDWNAHGQVAGCSNASCPQAINAGIDMYMAPDTWKPLWHSLVAQVKDGTIPTARIDDAVARILRVKMRLGIFEAGKPSSRLLAGKWDMLGSAEHRAIARQAVGESLVLLKNSGVLPIKPGARVLVAGDGADDVARQSGGWTLSWQGTGLDRAKFPGATTLWDGIRDATKAAGGSAELAPDGSYKAKPDVAIVVFGETPYAEFQGDLTSLQLRPELRAPLATMKKLKAAGVPVVAVMLTGRPLFVGPELNAADAFVVAWLPGSEGEGVADRLISTRAAPAPAFTGKLPTAWPVSAKAGAAALFPFGYGLSGREATTPWRPVSEDPGVTDADTGGVYLTRGAAAPGWSLRVTDDAADVTRITTLPARALGGRAEITAVDYQVQEGARRFRLPGGAPQVIDLESVTPIDLSRETNGDVRVVATLRPVGAVPGDLAMSIACAGAPCGKTVRLTAADLPANRWTTIGVPLKCFTNDTKAVTSVFRLATAAAATIDIARVSTGMVADKTVSCTP